MDFIALSIFVGPCIFMYFLFKALWQLLNFKGENDGENDKRVSKMFLPTFITGILLILYFIFVVPKFH